MNGILLRSGLSFGFVLGLAAATRAARNEPPVLESFTVVDIAEGTYSVEGEVDDEYPDECIVWFGGALSGYFAICESDGVFTMFVELGPYETGQVSARAFDNLDQGSNVEYDWILY